MDRGSLLNDSETAFRTALEGWQSGLWTAMPGVVKSVNLAKLTCEVQIAVQGTITEEDGSTRNVNYPLLADVPILFPSTAGFLITFPLAANDEVLVIFASRCIDSWWQSGGIANQPMEARMHDLSDAFAIPGPRSQPNVVANVSATDLEIRNTAGDTLLSITASGKIGFQNATTDLKEILTDLETLLNSFMGTLAAFGGGAAPVTQAMLQAPAATAATALSAVLTKIGALLK